MQKYNESLLNQAKRDCEKALLVMEKNHSMQQEGSVNELDILDVLDTYEQTTEYLKRIRDLLDIMKDCDRG